ncbi:hypothetical protein [uncultured Helicobacter sp.]|uniref:hypothetical protein n=1 Tax=uncultured Helicobacter sp. TaxID=175537 RepID=UPI003753041A
MRAQARAYSRPCRGGENQEKGGSSATADFSKETSFRLDKETARLSPRLPKRPNGLQAKPQQKQRRFILFGAGESGERGNPFSFAQTQDSKKLENIRENATLRNTKSKVDSESSAEILKDTQLTKSSHIDSETITESKEILKNEKRQNLAKFTSYPRHTHNTKTTHFHPQTPPPKTPPTPNPTNPLLTPCLLFHMKHFAPLPFHAIAHTPH